MTKHEKCHQQLTLFLGLSFVFRSLIRNFVAKMIQAMTFRRYLVTITTALTVAMVLVSCGQQSKKELLASRADSLIFAQGAVMNYDRMLALTDSFEVTGDISPLDANRWRGVYYYRQNQYRMAELCYR